MQERILLAGDSLIVFFDWQNYFADLECINLGVPGETVAGWCLLTQQAFTRCPDAQYVLVMLGANNICQQDYSFLPQYKILLVDLRGLYPDAQIVVCSLLPHELSWLGPAVIPRLNAGLQPMVEELGCTFLDLYTSFQTHGNGCFMEDGVHLSEMGYQLWCDVLEKWLHLQRSLI
jgi:lysophospholipase L1-like esterase